MLCAYTMCCFFFFITEQRTENWSFGPNDDKFSLTTHCAKQSESPPKNQACHGWKRCNGICLVFVPDVCKQSRTLTVASTPGLTGNFFMRGFRLFLTQDRCSRQLITPCEHCSFPNLCSNHVITRLPGLNLIIR